MSQGLRLSYVDWGNDQAPLLLLIHGSQDHCRSWDWTADQLCADWHVVAPDLRGHGESDWSAEGNYDRNYIARDILLLLRVLGDKPASIISHSLGAHIAMRVAGFHPEKVRQLVAIEGLGHPRTRLADRAALPLKKRFLDWSVQKDELAAKRSRHYEDLDAVMRRMKDAHARLSDEQARHLALHGTRRNADGSYSWKFDPQVYYPSLLDIALSEQNGLWREINCPVLHLYGLESYAASPRHDGRLDFFTDAKLVEIANAGHWLHHDQLSDFLRETRAFLSLPSS